MCDFPTRTIFVQDPVKSRIRIEIPGGPQNRARINFNPPRFSFVRWYSEGRKGVFERLMGDLLCVALWVSDAVPFHVQKKHF